MHNLFVTAGAHPVESAPFITDTGDILRRQDELLFGQIGYENRRMRRLGIGFVYEFSFTNSEAENGLDHLLQMHRGMVTGRLYLISSDTFEVSAGGGVEYVVAVSDEDTPLGHTNQRTADTFTTHAGGDLWISFGDLSPVADWAFLARYRYEFETQSDLEPIGDASLVTGHYLSLGLALRFWAAH